MTSPHTSVRGASPSPAADLIGRLVNSPDHPPSRCCAAAEPEPKSRSRSNCSSAPSPTCRASPRSRWPPRPWRRPRARPRASPAPRSSRSYPSGRSASSGSPATTTGLPCGSCASRRATPWTRPTCWPRSPTCPYAWTAPGSTSETGAYWTFCVHTGPVEAARDGGAGQDAAGHDGHTLVGASPEAHVRVRGDEVVMNPISGTYRYPAAGPDTDSLLTFLADSKERNELSMVVDEELKMLCAVADRDVRLHGPYLREMSHLAHTEFEIRGRGVKEVREVLSRTMFAATVTGSPLKSACRVIRAHEPSGRGYYAGALALFGQDASGQRWLDSPITIRTADVTPDGALRIPVGATLVRDSDPRSEVAETHAKLAGVLSAFGVTPARDAAARPAPRGLAVHSRGPRGPRRPSAEPGALLTRPRPARVAQRPDRPRLQAPQGGAGRGRRGRLHRDAGAPAAGGGPGHLRGPVRPPRPARGTAAPPGPGPARAGARQPERRRRPAHRRTAGTDRRTARRGARRRQPPRRRVPRLPVAVRGARTARAARRTPLPGNTREHSASWSSSAAR